MIEFSEDKKLIDERTKQNLQSVYLQIKDELMEQKDPQLQKKLRISVTLLVSHLDKSPVNHPPAKASGLLASSIDN